MEEKVDIVALGELLIDFTEAGYSQDGRKLFEQNPGGAPANLLTVASHFGYHTAFIGKVGTDMHGKFLKKTLQKEKINTDAILSSKIRIILQHWHLWKSVKMENGIFLLQENRGQIHS